MTIADLEAAALDVISMRDEYHRFPQREYLLDPVLYAYLTGRFGNMARQHGIRIGGRPRVQRIDFRFGGASPAVIEFAVRSPLGGSELYGSRNVSELRKLTRVPQSKAHRRFLLLIDLFRRPIALSNLKPSYDIVNAGRGNFVRHSVRVIYVHRDVQYDFVWRPRSM